MKSAAPSERSSPQIQPGQITWLVLPRLRPLTKRLREQLGEAQYGDYREALQIAICQYINATSCTQPGIQITPMGGSAHGGKCLKIRWLLPGGGKSGGLRIAAVAYCETRVVKLAGAWMRRDDPSDADFTDAFAAADQA